MKSKKRSTFVLFIFFFAISLLFPASPAKAAEGKIVRDGVVEYADATSLLYNRIIYYPEELIESDQHYPVIIWANGTACPPALYTKLLKGFAKEGYSHNLLYQSGSLYKICCKMDARMPGL